jgi:hypothetical protein
VKRENPGNRTISWFKGASKVQRRLINNANFGNSSRDNDVPAHFYARG